MMFAIQVFWAVTSSSMVKEYRHFAVMYQAYLQGMSSI